MVFLWQLEKILLVLLFSIGDIRDFIPDNHHCYLIEEIVNRIDF